jgi:hypothetical protein
LNQALLGLDALLVARPRLALAGIPDANWAALTSYLEATAAARPQAACVGPGGGVRKDEAPWAAAFDPLPGEVPKAELAAARAELQGLKE